MRYSYSLAAALAFPVALPEAPLATAATNPRRGVPLPPRAVGVSRAAVAPTTAPGQSARRARRLARHGKTV